MEFKKKFEEYATEGNSKLISIANGDKESVCIIEKSLNQQYEGEFEELTQKELNSLEEEAFDVEF